MKSLCIKTNNDDILNFINDKLLKLDLNSVFITNGQFKLYKNIIIHYTGDNAFFFYDKLSAVLTDTILYFYEAKLLRRLLEYNYFYFSSLEKKDILKTAKEFIEEDLICKEDNYFAIYYSVYDYIQESKSIVLDGFVNFRISTYMKNIDYIIDMSVNKYITDKEYIEFVNMLKLYVSITPPSTSLVHLIYFRR